MAFSKVGAGSGANTADTAPLLSENLFDSLSVEIVQMLDKVDMQCPIKFSECIMLRLNKNWIITAICNKRKDVRSSNDRHSNDAHTPTP